MEAETREILCVNPRGERYEKKQRENRKRKSIPNFRAKTCSSYNRLYGVFTPEIAIVWSDCDLFCLEQLEFKNRLFTHVTVDSCLGGHRL